MKATWACAIMLAVALPPTRGCKITIELHRIIGNSANMPDANEPILWLAVVTMATTAAAASARNGTSSGVRRSVLGGAGQAVAKLGGLAAATAAALSCSA